MDRNDPVDSPPFRRADEPVVGDAHGVQWARQFAFPKAQETLQSGEIGGEIVVLPHIELQQAGMIRQMVMDLP